jgi:hypothetical protein
MTDDVDGIYAAYMTGVSGQGFGMFVFQEGAITGADPLGVMFDGVYTAEQNSEKITGSVTVRVPPGGTVIQGVTSGPSGMTYEVPLVLDRDFDQVNFLKIETPLGPVNIKLNKLRALPKGR